MGTVSPSDIGLSVSVHRTMGMNIFALILALFELLKYISILSTMSGTFLFVIAISMIMGEKERPSVYATR